MDRTIVFYVLSEANLNKTNVLENLVKHLGNDYRVFPLFYETLHDYYENMINLLTQINKVAIDYPMDDVVLMGNSLGAYYAHQLSQKLSIGCVLINPVIDPKTNFADYVGKKLNTNIADSYNQLVWDRYPTLIHINRLATTVYVSSNDEVIADNVNWVDHTFGRTCKVITTDTKHRVTDFDQLPDLKHNVNMCAFNMAIFED